MKTQKLNKLLIKYKKIDLDLAVLQKQKELLKEKVKEIMEANDLDNCELGEYRVSSYTVKRTYYDKEKLNQYVDGRILRACEKVSVSKQLKIIYGKEDL